MKAALVGTTGAGRLYYIVDAKADEKDGAIEKADGTVIKVDFQSYVVRTRGIKRNTTTAFHKILWNGNIGKGEATWKQIFVDKSQEIPEEVLEGVLIRTSLGKAHKVISQKNDDASRYLKSLLDITDKSCCGDKVLKSITHKSLYLESEGERQIMWTAMTILREIEENDE